MRVELTYAVVIEVMNGRTDEHYRGDRLAGGDFSEESLINKDEP